MRIVTKAAIVLFVLYIAYVGGIAYWMERSVGSVSRSVLNNTARLIGNDVAAVIAKSAIEELRFGDPESRARLEQTIEDLTARSEVVSAVSVVDATGKIIASDEVSEVGHQVLLPDLLFPSEGYSDYGDPGLLQQDGVYHLFVPLLHEKNLIGYLRLALNSEPFTVVYSRGRRDLLVVLLSGLVAAVVLLSLLQITVRGRAERLLATLEETTSNHPRDEAAPVDEFTPVDEAGQRLGAQLTTALQRAAQAEQCFDASHAITHAAVLVLNADKTLRSANQRARDLIGFPAPGDLERRWNEVQALIEDAWESVAGDGSLARVQIEMVDTKPPRSLELTMTGLDAQGGSGFAIVIVDQTLGAAVAGDLAAALQLDALRANSLDAAATVRALSDTFDASIQALRASLEDGGNAQVSDRGEEQTEYIDTLEDSVATLDALCRTLLAQIHQRKAAYSAFDLRDLLAELTQLFAASAERKQIVLARNHLDAPLVLAAAYRPLREALLNLLLHILDWMPEGTVVAADVERTATQLSITWRCSAASSLSAQSWQLFEPHILDDQGAARVGLGVARTAVDSLGGKLDVYTAPAGGTCYRITVPLASKTASTLPGAVAS